MSVKLQIRFFLIHNLKKIINSKILFKYFPIILVGSKIFYSKHQNQVFFNIVKQNLPGLVSTQTQIFWPTFEQSLSEELQSNLPESCSSNTKNSFIKRIDFYTDFVLIQTNLDWHAKQKQFYIGACNNFKLPNFHSKKQIGNNWQTIISKNNKTHNNKIKHKKNWNINSNYQKKTINPVVISDSHQPQLEKFQIINKISSNLNKNIFLNLDELPLKVNFIFNNKQIFSDEILQNVLIITEPQFKNKKKLTVINESSTNLKLLSTKTKVKLEKFIQNKNSNSNSISLNFNKLFSGYLNNKKTIKNKKFFFVGKKIVLNKFKESVIVLKKTKNTNSEIIKNSPFNPCQTKSEQGNSYSQDYSYDCRQSQNQNYSFNLNETFLENKLRKIFDNKNLSLFSNFSELNLLFKNQKLKVCPGEKLTSSCSEATTDLIKLNCKEVKTSKQSTSFSSDILELITLIQKTSSFYENFVILPRMMSGYLVSDINYNDNLSLLTQFFYKNNCKLLHTIVPNSCKFFWNPLLQINLSKNFSYSLKFLHTKLTSPKLNFCSQPTNYSYDKTVFKENSNCQQKITIYNGISISQNEITNDLNLTNYDLVKKWIKQFLNYDNVLTDRRDIFFGKNIYADYQSNFKADIKTNFNTLKAPKVALLQKGRKTRTRFFEMPLKAPDLSVLQDETIPVEEKKLRYKQVLKPNSIIISNKYSYVMYLDKQDWNTFLNNFLKEKTKPFPITTVLFPNKKFITWPLNQLYLKDLNKLSFLNFSNESLQNFYSNLPQNLKKSNLKFSPVVIGAKHLPLQVVAKRNPISLIYHYFPYSQTLSKQILFKNYFKGKMYKKNFSIYSNTNLYKKQLKKFAKFFYQATEPITIDSWLFLTQFSIGLFLSQIIQNLSQKYGRELKFIVLNLLQGKNENSTDSDINENNSHEKFRLIKNIKKNFRDIVGIDTILPEVSELVWFLRNAGRSFTVGNTIPRRILLTGPPGTGKTLLVQAIAGEAQVPVLIESGSSLNQSATSENSLKRLQNIFAEARKIAPCIIFIDEIDSFGKARTEMIENAITNNTLVNSIYLNHKILKKNKVELENLDFIPQPEFSAINELVDLNNPAALKNEEFQKFSNNSKLTQENSNLLLQFLIELDGITTEKKIVVFGATNRPQILDSALTRPGRFNKIIKLDLPNKQKRIEILKSYSKNLGIETTSGISEEAKTWNYFADLTPGFSAADLAALMNQSSMKAIQNETVHTVQTIEYGIDTITGFNLQKNTLKFFTSKLKDTLPSTQKKKNIPKISSKFIFINRLAYYQAGKAIVHTLLKNHPKVVSVNLWPQLKNPRYHLVNSIIEKEFSQVKTRIELESRIIGFYGGKAAELLLLFYGFKTLEYSDKFGSETALTAKAFGTTKFKFKKSNNEHQHSSFYLWQSDLGIYDMNFAGWLTQLMIRNWYFYSKHISITKNNLLANNLNIENIYDNKIFQFFKQLALKIEVKNNKKIIFSKDFLGEKPVAGFHQQIKNSQNWIINPWVQNQITQKLEFFYRKKTNWSRIYQGEHEKNENTQYVFSDEYYHNNKCLNNLLIKNIYPIPFKSALSWNEKANLESDYIYHSLILSCFNKAISILDKNRELLDFFANSLLQKEIIREFELLDILNVFQKYKQKV